MTEQKEKDIVANYKHYMEQILDNLKEYDNQIKQQIADRKFYINNRGWLLFNSADTYWTILALYLRQIFENLAFAIKEANCVEFKNKDKEEKEQAKQEKRQPKPDYDNIQSAQEIIKRVSYFNPKCLPIAIQQAKPSSLILPYYYGESKTPSYKMRIDEFNMCYNILSEGGNSQGIHARNKNKQKDIYDIIFKKDKKKPKPL